jgi:hypothetical protein
MLGTAYLSMAFLLLWDAKAELPGHLRKFYAAVCLVDFGSSNSVRSAQYASYLQRFHSVRLEHG